MKRGVGDDPFADEPESAPATASDGEEPTTATPTSDEELADDIITALEAIESGDENKNISLRDREVKALLLALGNDQQRRHDLTTALDLDDEATQSDIVRTLIRTGLETAAPGIHEELATAIGEYARNSV